MSITTEEGSPWKATAGADPRYIRTSLIRMVATSAANQLEGNVEIHSFLVTQKYLLENQVESLNEFHDLLVDLTSARWMKPVEFCETEPSSIAPSASIPSPNPSPRPPVSSTIFSPPMTLVSNVASAFVHTLATLFVGSLIRYILSV
jgi:hypothetical protein